MILFEEKQTLLLHQYQRRKGSYCPVCGVRCGVRVRTLCCVLMLMICRTVETHVIRLCVLWCVWLYVFCGVLKG